MKMSMDLNILELLIIKLMIPLNGKLFLGKLDLYFQGNTVNFWRIQSFDLQSQWKGLLDLEFPL